MEEIDKITRLTAMDLGNIGKITLAQNIIFLSPTVFACSRKSNYPNMYFIMSITNCMPNTNNAILDAITWDDASLQAAKDFIEKAWNIGYQLVEIKQIYGRRIHFCNLYLETETNKWVSFTELLVSKSIAQVNLIASYVDNEKYFQDSINETTLIQLDGLITDEVEKSSWCYVPHKIRSTTDSEYLPNYFQKNITFQVQTPQTHSLPKRSIQPKWVPNFIQTGMGNHLPILEQKDDIINLIQNNEFIIVCGETGSGKSTQLPKFIMESNQLSNTGQRILLLQPRRVATKNIALRIRDETVDETMELVGYQMKDDSVLSEKNCLVVSTT